MKKGTLRKLGGAFGLAASSLAAAQNAPQQIEVTGHYDNAVGSSDAASQGTIHARLLESRPALRPGEVLEFVPGLVVTQHSGDGKANQYFLRGFNLDHGTDFATSVNGIPVNMPTHGHGQGYTDLNFLLPELVQRIEYRKGPYFATSGDFASAGSADIVYRTRLDAPFGEFALGEQGYRRAVLGGSGDVGSVTLLGAFEAMRNSGPWRLPEALRRTNGVFSASGGNGASGWSASLMSYRARWQATDQVPQRLIDAGTYDGRPFDRFSAIDPTDGGETSRSSLAGEWHRNDGTSATRVSAFALRYRLKLFSNFTYFLDDEDHGDQFAQQDQRGVWGLRASHAFSHASGRTEFGVQLRHDRIHVGLFGTEARRVLAVRRDDRVGETLAGAYGQTTLELLPALRAVLGLRADSLRARVQGLNSSIDSGRANATQWSPKLALVAGPFDKTEFFFNAGRGYHSNDARGMTDPVQRVPPLVASTGYEIGARSETLPGLQSSLALWKLDFGSELVYVGDAGVTAEGAASRRRGVEWNNRWLPAAWFLLDADLAWTHARLVTGARIPNAVDKVGSLAATLRDPGPLSASLQWRYLGSGPLVEDNRVRSRPSITTNLRLGWKFTPKVETTLDVFNLFDRPVDDIQYFYESRPLPGEDAVADRHVHPAEPRTLRLTLRAAL